jgi:hypothetical protein
MMIIGFAVKVSGESFPMGGLKRLAEGPLLRALPADVLTHIDRKLRTGKPLATCLQGRLPRGKVYAFLPGEFVWNSDTEVDSGGVFTGGAGLAALTRFLLELLADTQRRILVWEDLIAEPGDPWLASAHSPVFVADGTLYHFIRSDDEPTLEDVHASLLQTDDHFLVGAVAELPETHSLPNAGLVLEAPIISAICEHTIAVVVGAFDGEGSLIWRRSER